MYEEGRATELDKLATALAKAQAEFPAVSKSGKNPHLQTSYATLDDVIGATREPLAKNGLSFVQLLSTRNGGYEITTILLHESGQRLESTVQFSAGEATRGINALQALGATITYIKRYSLSAMLGVAVGEDDDGASGAAPRPKAPPKPQARPQPKPQAQPAPRTQKSGPVHAATTARRMSEVMAEEEAAARGERPAVVRAKSQPPAEMPEDALLIRNPTQLIGGLKWLGYYKHGRHVMATYNKIQGTDIKGWPDNPGFYPEAYELLVNYAQEQQELGQQELPGMEE